jgi:aspartate racemase
MKTTGLIGGLTWHSTIDYYRMLNQRVNEKLGGVASAKIIMYSVNFWEIKDLTFKEDWNAIAGIISDAAQKIENAGADNLLLCANTMHNIADKVQASISIPLIHIAEETAKEISKQHLKNIALLGTKYTMQMDFYKDKLSDKNIETIIPSQEDIEYINDAIYNEMGIGIFLPERKKGFLKIINKLTEQGAEAVVLACTEIPILIKQGDVSVPVFDTAEIHVKAAVEMIL